VGQKSLVRLNRLNVSMHWESELTPNIYHWLSVKLYLYLRLLIPFLFKVNIYNFFKLWGNYKNKNILSTVMFSGFLQVSLKSCLYTVYVKKTWKSFFIPLQIYISKMYNLTFIHLIHCNINKYITLWNSTNQNEKGLQLREINKTCYFYY